MATENLIIAQISDIHIGSTDSPYKNINVRQRLVEVLEILAAKQLDLLVFTGDLAVHAGEIEAYIWLKEALSKFPHPYILVAGNHDKTENMLRIFDSLEQDVTDGMLYFSRIVRGKCLIFLDSSSFTVPEQQLNWLQKQLVACQGKPILLFLHHPPSLCECRFMDENYPLRNIHELWPLLADSTSVQHIFCGHYHTAKTFKRDHKNIHITPSTVFQIDEENSDFTITHCNAGWRMIEWNGKELHTYVEYLDSSEK